MNIGLQLHAFISLAHQPGHVPKPFISLRFCIINMFVERFFLLERF